MVAVRGSPFLFLIHVLSTQPRYGCVINVSSGDGELAYLHSVAAKRLRAMRSLEVRVEWTLGAIPRDTKELK